MSNLLTFKKMYDYLIKQENCIINGKAFRVLDLHKTIKGFKDSIELYEPEDRGGNANCIRLKYMLEKIYFLHQENKFEIIKP
tara:strand:- start:5516 stop:5761 length:246 start_codon:yes stop_codon:yes gene_type:complete